MAEWMKVKKKKLREFWKENQLEKEDEGAFLDILNLSWKCPQSSWLYDDEAGGAA